MPNLLSSRFHKLPDGQQIRYACFEPSNPPLGTILIAPGRREFIEKKYSELGSEFLHRNFRQIYFEWRGQGLSDRLLNGNRRQRDHATDFSRHIDDLSSFYARIVKPLIVGKLYACGHSMGAHLLMRWIATHKPPELQGLILTSPMLAIGSHHINGAVNLLSWGADKLGFGEDYATGQHDFGADETRFEKNPLTSNAERFVIMERYFSAHPDMAVGGVTWGWLHAAMQSIHWLNSRTHLHAITVPTLAILGEMDIVTPPADNKLVLRHLPNIETHTLPAALHDIMNEQESHRSQAWRHINGFLGKN